MPPNFAIKNERMRDGFKVVEIDIKKATYQGRPWKSLGDFGKRKFENLVFLNNVKERIKIIYV
jgi:hypothetical protein